MNTVLTCGCLADDAICELPAAHSRHHQIGDEQVEGTVEAIEQLERLDPVASLDGRRTPRSRGRWSRARGRGPRPPRAAPPVSARLSTRPAVTPSGVAEGKLRPNGRALAGLALEANGAAALGDRAVHAREAEARPDALRLRGEERLERPLPRLGVHALAVVGDGDDGRTSRRPLVPEARLIAAATALLRRLDRRDGDRQRATGRHRVAGIEGQVDERLLDSLGIDSRERRVGCGDRRPARSGRRSDVGAASSPP